MPKVKRSVARKDYPAHDIKKGEAYYSWKHYRGLVQRSKTYPRPSQLTQSAWSSILAEWESLEDLVEGYREKLGCTHTDIANLSAESIKQDVIASLESLSQAAQEAADEKRDLADEHFGGEGPHAEQADAMEEVVSMADSACTDVDDLDEKPTDWDEWFDLLYSVCEDCDPGAYQI